MAVRVLGEVVQVIRRAPVRLDLRGLAYLCYNPTRLPVYATFQLDGPKAPQMNQSQEKVTLLAEELSHEAVRDQGKRRLTWRFLSLLGIERTREGYALLFSGLVVSRWLVSVVVGCYFFLFLVTLVRFPLFSPVATVDEQLIYYQTARNFVKYGFVNSGFLHDLSTSSDPAQHPYVYTHMPPGPEIFIALLVKIFGERYALIRFAFGGLFLVGVYYFFRFTKLVLGAYGLAGEGYAILLLSPYTVLHAIDHPAYSLFPFFAFFPVVALHSFYGTGKRVHYYLALLVVLLASVYAVTLNFILFLASWGLLCLLRVVRFDVRHYLAFFTMGLVGVLLHLVQGILFLGPTVFLEELRITFSNRIFGTPSAEEVMAFYRAHDIVLHGTHHFDLFRLLVSINNALRFPGRIFFAVLALGLVSWALIRVARYDHARRALIIPNGLQFAQMPTIAPVLKLAVWTIGTIVIPLLLFPAYTADYGLQGLGEFILAVWAVSVLACVVRELAGELSGLTLRWSTISLIRGSAGMLVAIVFIVSVAAMGYTQRRNLAEIVPAELGANPHADLMEVGRQLKGKVIMTNVYPTTASFFTQEAAFGGCELAAFPLHGVVDPSKCHAAFIKGYGRGANVVPSHYILFRSLFTGFTLCLQECLDDLYERVASQYRIVFETKEFTIFALRDH